MEKEQFFEDYEIGAVRQTLRRTITEADIIFHAGHTGDYHPNHMDTEFCKTRTFKRPIAHGTMTFAIGLGLATSEINPRTLTYGFERLRFPNPVYVGDTIQTKVTVKSKEEDRARPGYGKIIEIKEVTNQDGKTVMYVEHILIVDMKGERIRK